MDIYNGKRMFDGMLPIFSLAGFCNFSHPVLTGITIPVRRFLRDSFYYTISVLSGYLINVNKRFQRIFPLFTENHISSGLPTMWSSGTYPQYLESIELWRLSPIIQ